MHARGSQHIEKLLSSYQAEANLDGSRICRGSIEQTESFLMDQESVKKPLRQILESSMDRDCANFY